MSSMSSSIIWMLLISILQKTTHTQTIIASTSEYKGQTIQCNGNSDCFVHCKEYEACEGANIFCPINNACIVSCGKYSTACKGTTIDARYSSLFELNDCSSGQDSTCSDMTIYFPPNENGNPRSSLNTGDNMKQSLTFYAVYGWLDIDTSDYIGTYDDIDGKMYCGYWYQYSCEMDDDDWICENSNDYCNNPPTPPTPPTPSKPSTSSPTASPTNLPTNLPTNEPSIQASQSPTNSIITTAINMISVTESQEDVDDVKETHVEIESIESYEETGRGELFNNGQELSSAANDTTYLEVVIGALIGCLCLCTCLFSYYVFRHSKFYRRAMDIDKTKKIQRAKAKKAKAKKHHRSKSKSKSKVTQIIIANNMSHTSEEDERYPMHKKSKSAMNQRMRNNALLNTTCNKHCKSSSFPHQQQSCHSLGETPIPNEHDEVNNNNNNVSRSVLPYNTTQGNIIARELTPTFGSIANDRSKDTIPSKSKSEGHGDEEEDDIVDNNDMNDITITMTQSQQKRMITSSNQDSADSVGGNSYTDYLRHKKPSIDTVENDNDTQSQDIETETNTIISRISSLSDITSMLDYFNVIGKNKSRNVLSNDGINKMNGISHPATDIIDNNNNNSHKAKTVSPCVKLHDIIPPPQSHHNTESLPSLTPKKQLRLQSYAATPILRVSSSKRGNSNNSNQSNKSKVATLRLTLDDDFSGSVSTIQTRSDNTPSNPVIDTARNRVFVDNDDDHEAGSGSNTDDSLFKHDNDNDIDNDIDNDNDNNCNNRNVIAKCKSGESMTNNGFIFGNRRILHDNTAPSDCTINRMDRCLSPCNYTARSSSSNSSDESTLSSNLDEDSDDRDTFKINSDKCDAMSSDTWITYYKGDNNSNNNNNRNSSKYYGSDD